MSTADFEPDWASPPGDTIVDILKERGILYTQLAACLGLSTAYVLELPDGHEAISHDVAVGLERCLGGSANFWLNREEQYRESLRRLADVGSDDRHEGNSAE